jgi:hypothetical protein
VAVTAAVTAFIVVALAIAAIFGVAAGLDPVAVILFAVIAAFGVLSIAIARRMRTGAIGPVVCSECGGVISAGAPYCKHCNAPR